MSTTETQIRDALSAAVDTREVDVDRLWQQFRIHEAQPPARRNPWLIPLGAAAATVLMLALVVVVRTHVTRSASTTPASTQSLSQLPPWPNGTAATTYPLPTPASTPVTFDAADTRLVVFYAANPSRLCVVEISRSVGQPAHTTSIGCEGERGYVVTPVDAGPIWALGTVPPGTRKVQITIGGQPARVLVVNGAHMPRAVFFAQYPQISDPVGAHPITWKFIGAHGQVIEDGGNAPRSLRPPSFPPFGTHPPLTFHATPVSGTATFHEITGRVLHIYYAGTKHGYCSNEQVAVTGRRPATVSEDCGFTVSADRVYGLTQWLPADSGGSVTTATTFWGVMPPGAVKTVVVTATGTPQVSSAQPTGMPNGVYAGSLDGGGEAAVMYFLDSDGHVVAATTWTPLS